MKEFFAFKNTQSVEAADLVIYDEISFWGVSAKTFHNEMKGIKAKTLNVRINSPGGSVVDGYAIYNMLRNFKGDVVVFVDGIAASIAAVIAMAGKRIVMPENALMFIHEPLVNYTSGNAEELRKIAEDLDKMRDGILSIFEARTGADRAKISSMMAEETMMTAKEAKALGFADEIIAENKAQAKFDPKHFFDGKTLDSVNRAVNITLPAEVIPTPVGRSTNNDTTMNEAEQKRLDDALEQVRVLKGEKSTAETQLVDARNKAQQDITNAGNTALTNEKARKKSLTDYAAKFNKDGDLNDILVEAISGDTTLDAFKDKVMEVVNERPAKAAAKKGGDDDGDSFEKKYAACKTMGEKRALVKANAAEARKLSRAR